MTGYSESNTPPYDFPWSLANRASWRFFSSSRFLVPASLINAETDGAAFIAAAPMGVSGLIGEFINLVSWLLGLGSAFISDYCKHFPPSWLRESFRHALVVGLFVVDHQEVVGLAIDLVIHFQKLLLR
jgi:hypothetical protein